jgi:hypothetical protein
VTKENPPQATPCECSGQAGFFLGFQPQFCPGSFEKEERPPERLLPLSLDEALDIAVGTIEVPTR